MHIHNNLVAGRDKCFCQIRIRQRGSFGVGAGAALGRCTDHTDMVMGTRQYQRMSAVERNLAAPTNRGSSSAGKVQFGYTNAIFLDSTWVWFVGSVVFACGLNDAMCVGRGGVSRLIGLRLLDQLMGKQ
jgi:hypothetical protein